MLLVCCMGDKAGYAAMPMFSLAVWPRPLAKESSWTRDGVPLSQAQPAWQWWQWDGVWQQVALGLDGTVR